MCLCARARFRVPVLHSWYARAHEPLSYLRDDTCVPRTSARTRGYVLIPINERSFCGRERSCERKGRSCKLRDERAQSRTIGVGINRVLRARTPYRATLAIFNGSIYLRSTIAVARFLARLPFAISFAFQEILLACARYRDACSACIRPAIAEFADRYVITLRQAEISRTFVAVLHRVTIRTDKLVVAYSSARERVLLDRREISRRIK